jgi:hypothetical protein
MKCSKPFLLLAIGAALATSQAATGSGRHYASPPIGDAYRAWTHERMETMTSEDDFDSDEVLTMRYLKDPASIYSDLAVSFYDTPSTRQRNAWLRMKREVDRRHPFVLYDEDNLRRAIAWDLGFTKALPGYQVLPDPTAPTPGNVANEVAVNIAKSGVDLTLWTRAVNLADNGGALTTLGAEYAVAMQVVSDWIANTPDERKAMRLGIDAGIVSRFSHASSLADIPDRDLAYVAAVLGSELSTWRAGRINRYGVRELPTPLRIARATMMHWAQSAPSPSGCAADGSGVALGAAQQAGDLKKPMCTSEATDRAVYARYRKLREYQTHRPAESYADPVQAERLIRFFSTVRPAWASIFREEALDYSNHAEVVEAQMAAEAFPGEDNDVRFWRLMERANLLICKSAAQ